MFLQTENTYSWNVVISNIIVRTDNGKAILTGKRFNEKLSRLKVQVLDHSYITSNYLGRKGLHLTSLYGSAKLAKNFLVSLRNLLRVESDLSKLMCTVTALHPNARAFVPFRNYSQHTPNVKLNNILAGLNHNAEVFVPSRENFSNKIGTPRCQPPITPENNPLLNGHLSDTPTCKSLDIPQNVSILSDNDYLDK